jgi:hypothetical protein
MKETVPVGHKLGARGRIVIKALATSRKLVGSRPYKVNENFSIYLIFPATPRPEVHSACNRNEYQKQKNNVSGE